MTTAPMTFTFAQRPQRVYWETTRACDLACRHCRAEAVPQADPHELTHEEGLALLAQIAAFGAPLPHVVFTGGDALKRKDLFELIAAAQDHGLRVSVAPSATPLLTEDALRQLKAAGVDAISLSIDAATAEHHDAIRGIPGTFARTLDAAHVARAIDLPFQVNTLVCAETVDDLEAVYSLVKEIGAARWSLFFLVTVGRGQVLQPISPERAEAVLQWIAGFTGRPGPGGLIVTTTEAPQLRRVIAQRKASQPPAPEPAAPAGNRPAHHAGGIRDGNGILFISHTGDICPSGFLEVAAGNVRRDDLVDVYRHFPMFTALRDVDSFSGRCGHCEFRWVCGGSRARAYAASGDLLAEDPLCVHQPSLQPAADRVTPP